VGQQCLFDVRWLESGFVVKRIESHDDSRGAETALTAAGCAQRLAPHRRSIGIETIDRGDRSTLHASSRGHTRHSRLAIDQHRAATALSLRTTTIFDRTDPRSSQDVKQRLARLDERDGLAINGQLEFWCFGSFRLGHGER